VILDEILARRHHDLAERQRGVPLEEVIALGRNRRAPLDLAACLRRPGVSLIAEVKRASPSKGLLCPEFSALGLADVYVENGAAAISVLTEPRYFGGKLDHLLQVHRRVTGDVPLLRKDFIFDPYQIHEAYAYGADAVLLITAVLSDQLLDQLLGLTRELGMVGIVEVHNEDETGRVLRHEPRVIGINNRDLRDFSVDLNTFGRLRSLLPDTVVAVAESGVHSAEDVQRLASMGADAVLVGEALVTAEDPAAKVRELVAAGRV
jgi:indole-3-glycerol phosphate synthase